MFPAIGPVFGKKLFVIHAGLIGLDTPHNLITDTALWRRRRWLRVR